MIGQASGPGVDPQQAVARAREHVLGGRGPGASGTERERCQRERPMLGPWPAPLEREAVHLHTAAVRAERPEVAAAELRRRLRRVWATGSGEG